MELGSRFQVEVNTVLIQKLSNQTILPCVVVLVSVCALTTNTFSSEIDAKQREFFESRIRPVLVEHCYECHSADAEKLKGELLLDSKPGWEKGGESGPAIVPGDPDESSIMGAIRYETFEMPPKAKLPENVINDFHTWIKMGAPDPRTEATAAKPAESSSADDRENFWSLQPVQEISVPKVQAEAWPRSDVDRFILAGLESKAWKPAEPANRHSWLRRVTFDLTGLPPTPEEVHDFLNDSSEDAFEHVVDRLLQSPHFGEQWARHWMDLVRYAETKAFEADYPMPGVYHYRDYLIRAFNDNVSYKQLLREAIAGDLIEPRLNENTGVNESVMGPGYLYLTDGQHGPPDLHDDEARIFDDMIDVIGKAFLGMTVACTRCHDHKFDALSMKDYYSLYGIIASSRIDYADINPPAAQLEARTKLRTEKHKVHRALSDLLREDMRNVAGDLTAVANGAAESEQQKRWAASIEKPANSTLQAFADLLGAKTEQEIHATWEKLRKTDAERGDLGGLTRDSFGDWRSSGITFEDTPRPAGDFVITADGDNVVSSFIGGRPAGGHLAARFAGSIRSPRFTIEGDSVSVRVKGKNVRVSLYVRHYELIGRGPTTGGTTKVINSDDWQTVRFGTNLWVGENAYIEVQHNGGQLNFDWDFGGHVDGSYAVLDIAVNNKQLPDLPSEARPLGISNEAPSTKEHVIQHIAKQIQAAVDAWNPDNVETITLAQSDLIQALHEAKVLHLSTNRSESLRSIVDRYRTLQKDLPAPTYVRSLADGAGIDEPIYIRGSHKNLSPDPTPRHFLSCIDAAPYSSDGSGRKQWAEALASDDNPLTARVAVNRIWHHLFGRGIVPSVDDFGYMGVRPSNPDLLDFLTKQFVDSGWNTKALIRELVLSSTYRMSSNASPESLATDPDNTLLQHMPVRRLQAESIRDTLLAVSGALDRQLYGPSQKGDGGNRRSVYIQLRRRFMPDFLMTFDMPNAAETFGRRNVTSGPTQSLAFMNGDFAWKAANEWAKRLAAAELDFSQKVDLIHHQAFGRPASDTEQAWARELLGDFGVTESTMTEEHWKEFCHTMLNRKELIYVF
ncbi:MAG: PSD1 domain-containing protein [Planctomycetales bacterium]|nr:PSD1 domain-containing protein [Planctomycetales bacterium]